MPTVREHMRGGKAGAPGPSRLGFGKYCGMVLADVPTGYLAWLAGRPDLLPSLKAAALVELDGRRMESGAVAEVRELLADLRAQRARGGG